MANSFGAKLRYARLQAGMTQQTLADRLGLASHAHVSKLETDWSAPSLTVVLRVANIFNISTDYWLDTSIALTADSHYPLSIPFQETLPKHFGGKLRALRQHLRLSQADVAQKLSLRTHVFISELETGRKEPPTNIVLQLAKVLNVPTEYLLNDAIRGKHTGQSRRKE